MIQKYLIHAPSQPCRYWGEGENTRVPVHVMPKKPEQLSDEQMRAFKFDMLEKGATSNMDGTVCLADCADCLVDHFCRAVRISHRAFELSDSQKRKLENFHDNYTTMITKPVYDQCLLRLYKDYIQARHGHTGNPMLGHTADDLKHRMEKAAWMVVGRDRKNGEPVSFAMLDQHDESFCLEYIAYDMQQMKRSPGLSTILATAHFLKYAYPDGYLYLGSWSPGSPKLNYKNQFTGLEVRAENGWRPLPRNAGPKDAPPPLSLKSFG